MNTNMPQLDMTKLRQHILHELTFVIGDDTFTITPKMGDKAELLSQLAKLEDEKDAVRGLQIQQDFISALFIREHKTHNTHTSPEDELAIKQFVSDNIIELTQQLMVGFKIASKDDLDEKKKQLSLKK